MSADSDTTTDVEQNEPTFSELDDDADAIEHNEICRVFGHGVSIKMRMQGVAMYAVYDGDKQVSAEVGPLNDTDLIAYAEGYAKKAALEAENGGDSE
jgi:hypothetical protein